MSGTIAYSFPARFAGVDLEIETWTEEIGRSVIQHRPSRGQGAQLSDRGRVPATYNISVHLTGSASEVTAKHATMKALRESGDTRLFEHPLDGAVRCKLSEFSATVGAGNASFSMSLIEDVVFAQRFADLAPLSAASQLDVVITGDALTASLALIPPPTSAVPDIDELVSTTTTWTERAQSDVVADVEAMRSSFTDLRRELDRSADVAVYQASVSLEAFRGTYERYAQAVNDIRGQVFDLTVGRSVPLVVLLSSLFGASEAEALLDETARINDVVDASRLAAGTVLSLPVGLVRKASG